MGGDVRVRFCFIVSLDNTIAILLSQTSGKQEGITVWRISLLYIIIFSKEE